MAVPEMDASAMFTQSRASYVPGKRRKTDIEMDESESIFANTASNNSKSKSKETFVVLVTVLLMLVMGLMTMGYLYYNESVMRQELVVEANKNFEILKACDRFDLNDVDHLQSRISGKTASAIESAASCPPCPKCHSYLQPKGPKQIKADKARKETQKLRDTIISRLQRNNVIEDSLQRVSRELFIMKYGDTAGSRSSPLQIEMHLKLPTKVKTRKAESHQLTFDMHDRDVLPYSMLYFIAQISAGLWDSCSFTTYYSAHHMLIAEARGNNCNSKGFKEVSFVDELLLFSEYSMGMPPGDVGGVKNKETPQSASTSVAAIYPHDTDYCISISRELMTPNFYIVLPSTLPAPTKLRGKPVHHQSPKRDYYSHYHHNGLLTDSDVCIGKLTPDSVATLHKLLELPTHFSKAGGNPAQDTGTDTDTDTDMEVGASTSEEGESEESSAETVTDGAPLTIDAKYMFEKFATITRARIKS